MENKNLWLIHTKQDPIKGQLILRHIWKGTPNECRSLWRFDEDVVIGGIRQYTTLNGSFRDVYTSFKPQYLYVTSKYPYEKGDWVKNITIEAEPPFKLDVHGIRYTQLAPCKFEKIVLTTDDYLIQDGIHSIEDDFLDWFCKNSTCQNVEFTKNYLSNDGQWKEVLLPSEWEVDTKVGYKIIIPKEESKEVGIDWSGFPKSTQEQVGYVEPKQENIKRIDSDLPDLSNLPKTEKEKFLSQFIIENGKYLIAFMEMFGLKTHIECRVVDDKNNKSFMFFFREENYHKEQQSENRFSEADMLKASEYGYNFHKITQFPEQDFDDSCVRNTQQWLTTFEN